MEAWLAKEIMLLLLVCSAAASSPEKIETSGIFLMPPGNYGGGQDKSRERRNTG